MEEQIPSMDMTERMEVAAQKPKTKHYGDGVYYEKIYSSTTLPTTQHSRPLIFTISPVKGSVIDLSLLKLYLKIRVVKNDGSKMKEDDLVLPKSAPLYTMFKDLEVYFNNTTVFTSRGMYPWYANIFFQLKADHTTVPSDTVQYFDDNYDMQKEWKTVKDKAGKNKRQMTNYSGQNVLPKWEDRAAAFQFSNYQELFGSVLFDLCFQSKFLRDDVEVRMVFTPAQPRLSLFASALNAGDKYYIEIDTAYIYVPRFKLNPRYSLPKGKLDYFYVDNMFSVHMLAKDVQNVNKQLSSGPIPRRVGFFFVAEDAFNGDMHRSPFAYKPFGVSSFQLTIGDKRYPTDPLKVDFKEDMCSEMYLYFLDQVRSYGVLSKGKMSLDKYKENRVFIFFDLTEDMSAGSSYHVEQEDGIMAVSIQFADPLPENVVMIQASEYDRSLEISKNSQVVVGEAGGVS